MPAASAFGALVTQDRPTSRERSCFVSFLFRRQSAYTAAGPRAGACRLRRFWGRGDGENGGVSRKGDSQGSGLLSGCRPAVPAASAFGGVFTRPSPTSRGRVCCVSVRMRRPCGQTAAGGEVKGGWGRRRAPDVRPYVLGICEEMEGRCAKGKGIGLGGRRIGPAACPPTAKARPSVDLKT